MYKSGRAKYESFVSVRCNAVSSDTQLDRPTNILIIEHIIKAFATLILLYENKKGCIKYARSANSRNLFSRVINLVAYKLQKIRNSYNKNEPIPNEIQLLFQRFEQKRMEGFNFSSASVCPK